MFLTIRMHLMKTTYTNYSPENEAHYLRVFLNIFYFTTFAVDVRIQAGTTRRQLLSQPDSAAANAAATTKRIHDETYHSGQLTSIAQQQ